MKALPRRKGNTLTSRVITERQIASMKALPRRKGNMLIDPPGFCAIMPQ